MSTSTLPPTSAGLVQITSIEEQIRERVAEERARLEREAGVVHKQVHHFHKPVERPFTADQRAKTTLLFGGLTWKHEKLVHGALEGLGYKCEVVPTPNVKAFQLGKEYGNNGQCNPTYFTVGNLVNYLKEMRDEKGVPTEKIVNDHIALRTYNAIANSLPDAVSDTLPPERSSNFAPTSSSSERICEEIAGCVRKRFSAAREKLDRRATSMNVSS